MVIVAYVAALNEKGSSETIRVTMAAPTPATK